MARLVKCPELNYGITLGHLIGKAVITLIRHYVFQGVTYVVSTDIAISQPMLAKLHDGEFYGITLTAEMRDELKRNSAREQHRIERMIGENWQ